MRAFGMWNVVMRMHDTHGFVSFVVFGIAFDVWDVGKL